jgi:tRNA (cmo5U34)-methyltransferase
MNIQAIFDSAAQDYDRTRRQLIPCFDEFYGTVLEVLPFGPEDAPHILDVGAGTGLLTALLAAALPKATFTLVDISPQMLEQAKARFGEDTRFQYQVVDFQTDHLPHPCDAVVSALSLHHAELMELSKVFRRIHAALAPKGLFVNADQVLGVTHGNEAKYEAVWRSSARQLGCNEADLTAAIGRMKADRTATLDDQLDTLRNVGFEDVECWYKNFRFAVYSGRKG